MKQLNRYLLIFILLPLVACADNSSDKDASADNKKPVAQAEQTANKIEAKEPSAKASDTEQRVQSPVTDTATTAPVSSPADFDSSQYKEGVHYERLPQPVATADRNKVEVVEVFWYGCIHCYQFEPQLEMWAKQLPSYIDYKSMPAVWRNEMLLHAQAFYTAKALGVFDKMHAALFDEMNKNGNRLENESKIAKLFIANGVSKDDFEKTFNSFGVKSSTGVAKSRLRSYRITGTPEMIVNGKFRLSGRMAGDNTNMLKVVNWLVQKERQEMLNEQEEIK